MCLIEIDVRICLFVCIWCMYMLLNDRFIYTSQCSCDSSRDALYFFQHKKILIVWVFYYNINLGKIINLCKILVKIKKKNIFTKKQ